MYQIDTVVHSLIPLCFVLSRQQSQSTRLARFFLTIRNAISTSVWIQAYRSCRSKYLPASNRQLINLQLLTQLRKNQVIVLAHFDTSKLTFVEIK